MKGKKVMNLLLISLFVFTALIGNIKPITAATSSTWKDTELLSSTSFPADSAMAVDTNGYLYHAVCLHSGDYYMILVYRSTNSGESWSVWSTPYSSSSYSVDGVDIAVDVYNNDIYVVFHRTGIGTGYNYITLVRITQGQLKYIHTVRSATATGTDLEYPNIAITWDGGSINYVFIAYGKYNTAVGTTWGFEVMWETTNIIRGGSLSWTEWHDSHSTAYNRRHIDLAVDERYNHLYMVYERDSTSETEEIIRLGFGSYGLDDSDAKTWVTVQENNIYSLHYPTIAITHSTLSSTRVAVAWYKNSYHTYYDTNLAYALVVADGGTHSWTQVSIDSSASRNAVQPILTVDGMDRSTSYYGQFWISYRTFPEGSTGEYAYVVKSAPYSALSTWTEYHKSTAYYPMSNYQRTFGISTFQKTHGGYGVGISYQRSTGAVYVAGDFIGVNTPVLSSPDNGELINDNTPTLNWEDVNGAYRYLYYVRVGSSTGTVLASGWSYDSTETVDLSSYGDGTYFWSVRPYDSGGNTGPWATYRSFTIDITSPGAPNLWDYAGGTNVNLMPTLTWSIPATDIARYTIYVSRYDDFSLIHKYDYPTTNEYIPTGLTNDTYYWKVLAVDLAGNVGPWSTTGEFTVDTIPPDSPTIFSPTNGSITTSYTVPLEWSDEGCETYQIQYTLDPTFSSGVGTISTSGTTYSLSLIAEGWNYWRVRGRDAAFNWCGYSTIGAINLQYSGPILTAPQNNSFFNSDPDFYWDPIPDADGYYFAIEAGPNLGGLIWDTGITDPYYLFSLENLYLSDGIYSWHVRASFDGEFTEYSDTWIFTIDTTPPDVPTLSGPNNETITGSNSPILRWLGDSSYFNIQIAHDKDFSDIYFENVTNSLLYQGTYDSDDYWWRLRAQDEAGNWGEFSAPWKFTILNDAPILLAPLNDSYINYQPIFSWEPIPEASYYRIEIGYTNGAGQSHVGFNSTGSTYTPSLNGYTFIEGSCYWRVDAYVGNGFTRFLEWKLTIDFTPPGTPSLVFPTNGDSLDNDVILDWSEVMNASFYQVQLSTNDEFSSMLVDLELVNTEYTLPTLTEGSYWWRVRARDEAGNWGGWASVYEFAIDIPPEAPILLFPSNNTFFNTGLIEFSWESVDDALEYSIQFSSTPSFVSPMGYITSYQNQSHSFVNGLHYWRVRASNEAGTWGEWSEIWCFTIDTISPGVPTLLFPTADTITNTSLIEFSWELVDDASEYILLLSTNGQFTSSMEFLTTNQQLSIAIDEGRFWWSVRARDKAGNNRSAIARIIIIDTTPPAAPNLISPSNNSEMLLNTPIYYEWVSVANDTIASDSVTYIIQISTDPQFSDEMTEFRLTYDTYVTITSLAEGDWYWRVIAYDSAENIGSWSEIRHFTVIIPIETTTTTIPVTSETTPTEEPSTDESTTTNSEEESSEHPIITTSTTVPPPISSTPGFELMILILISLLGYGKRKEE